MDGWKLKNYSFDVFRSIKKMVSSLAENNRTHVFFEVFSHSASVFFTQAPSLATGTSEMQIWKMLFSYFFLSFTWLIFRFLAVSFPEICACALFYNKKKLGNLILKILEGINFQLMDSLSPRKKNTP